LKFGIADLPFALTRASGFDIPGTLYEAKCLSIEDIMRVAKWGNSLAVRLPKALVETLALKAGDELEVIDATRGRLAVAKDERRKKALERLASMRIKLPPDYKFDREEANER
jgi:antitoxin MazE